MKPLVSIIIPVYQVEKYLDKCVASVVNQTYTNLEIILIDDGSPDNCPAICDKWKSRDPRITVIHQQNGGLSVARNKGLKLASGEFIGFVDSDDWIEPEMYKILLTALLETEADIAFCKFQSETESTKAVRSKQASNERKIYSRKEALEMQLRGHIASAVWNKIYRRNILSNISFPEGKICEDHLWTPLVIGNAKLIVCVNHSLYHYFQRPDSLIRNNKLAVKRGLDRIELCKQRTNYIRKNYPALAGIANLELLNLLSSEYIKIKLNSHGFDEDGRILRELHQIFLESGVNNIRNYDGFRTTFNRIMFLICPNLQIQIYCFCKSCKNKLRPLIYQWKGNKHHYYR